MNVPETLSDAPDFLVEMIYELRTPLTSIHGALGLLQAGVCGKIPDQGQPLLKIAINNTERLMRLTAAIEQETPPATGVLSMAMMHRLRLETDLRSALVRQQFRVYYQPIYNLETQSVLGFEALIRWFHPTLGLLAPDAYIPLAEASGLIGEIGEWVLWEACRQLRLWQEQFPNKHDLTMSVNLSSQQLGNPHLVAQVRQILQETHLAPTSLKLEITESSMMNNADLGATLLFQLRQMGIQIYIDDFGMGYSSLSRLHELPIDVLKIDRSFVSQIGSQLNQPAIIQSITSLAQNLQMAVIAEGIESLEQVTKLKSLGCNVGQGFLFSEPVPAETITTLLGEAA